MDATSNVEEYNLKLFLVVTHSPVGSLPLAAFVTSDETTVTLTQALELVAETLPPGAFYGKGPKKGPNIVMTDNCSELRDALHIVWPEAELLLCVFHLLQQVCGFEIWNIAKENKYMRKKPIKS